MQYYSSDESEEEDDFHWDPNEHIDRILEEPDDEQRKELKIELLEKFLMLRHPMMSSKMSEFMEEEVMVPDLVGFVTRIDENPEKDDELTPLQRVNRVVDDAEFDGETRRSFNVMSLFSSHSSEFHDFAANHLEEILTQLNEIFTPASNGNFYHFNRIIDALITRSPQEVTEILLSHGLLWKWFDYLHESPVLEVLTSVLCCAFHRQSDAINFYKSLIRYDFFGQLGIRLYGPEAHAGNALDIAEFLSKVLEKLSMIEVSGVLFIGMCRTSDFIDGLMNVVASEDQHHPVFQRRACALVARDLLVRSGEKLFDQTDFGAKPMPNMLASVFDKLHTFAARHLVKLCNVFVSADEKRVDVQPRPYSAYVVKRPLGVLRFLMVEIFADLVTNDSHLLNEVPVNTWRVLSNWFLDYPHNNLYHGLFVRVVRQAILEEHDPTLKALFSRYKFLTKMLTHFTSAELSDCRGFILLLLNTIRLKAEVLPPSSYLRHYLTSHDQWRQFMPELRAATLIQTRKFADMADEFQLDDDDDDDDDEGIDLGSTYAHSLGFDEDMPYIEPGSATDLALHSSNGILESSSRDEEQSVSSSGTPSESAQPVKLTKSQRRRQRRRSRGEAMKAHQEKGTEDAPQSPEDETASPSWWKDLVSDLGEENASNDDDTNGTEADPDWWKDLADEIDDAAKA